MDGAIGPLVDHEDLLDGSTGDALSPFGPS